jgi:hypothetical protein
LEGCPLTCTLRTLRVVVIVEFSASDCSGSFSMWLKASWLLLPSGNLSVCLCVGLLTGACETCIHVLAIAAASAATMSQRWQRSCELAR